MGRTRLANASIVELKRRISIAEERKKYFEKYLHNLWDNYQKDLISRDFYVETAYRHFDGKTLKEWVDYYEHYIEECKRYLRKHRKDRVKGHFAILVFSVLIIFLALFLISKTQIQLPITGFVSFNVSDTREIGYEFLDDDKVVHIWNTQDDYFFNRSSGIQFTNHFQEYWTRNIFCLGYYSGEEWIKINCADELNNFNRNIQTDNETYVNATLWKDISYGNYDMRLGINYYLGLNDKNLSITIYGKNIGDDIPFDLGFAWKITEWDIPPSEREDYIKVNNTNYLINSVNDTIMFKEMDNSFIKGFDNREYLRVDWNENLNYKVKMYGNGIQEDFYVALLINAGHFNPQQEKQTTFQWIDAIEVDDTSDGTDAGEEVLIVEHTTTGTATNGILIVTVQVTDASESDRIITNVSYNNMGLTHLTGANSDDNVEARTEIWYLTNPPETTANIIVNTTGTCTDLSLGAISLTGVNNTESTFVAQNATGDSTPPTLDITTVGDSSYVIDSLSSRDPDGTEINPTTAGGISIHDTDVGSDVHASTYVDAGGAGVQTMNYSDVDLDTIWVMSAVAIQALEIVEWNQTSLNLGESTNNITSVVEISSFMANTDTKVDCTGNCTQITTNWTQRTMTNGQVDAVLVTCSNATQGIFNAVFNVTSDEDTSNNLFTVDCEIFSYGWLNVSIQKPDDNSEWYQNYANLTVNATVICEGGSNARCGTVEALARYNLTASPDTAINVTEGGNPFYIMGAGGIITSDYDGVSTANDGDFPNTTLQGGAGLGAYCTNNDPYSPNADPSSTTTLSDGEYSAIWTSDFTNYTINEETQSESCAVFHINISEDSEEFTFYWVGYGDGLNDDEEISIWNVTANDWSIVDDTIPSSRTLQEWVFSDVSNYLDVNVIHILITGGADLQTGVGGIHTDYLNISFIGVGAENPQSTTLNKDDSYQFNWTLNVTTVSIESYLIDVLFNSTTYYPSITENHTEDRTVKLNPSAEDTAPPKWFDNSTNSTVAGTFVKHNVRWTDAGLSGYIFSFNNGSGTFANDSWVPFTGTNNWSNVSKIANHTIGSTIQWQVYANDTASPSNWNATDVFTYDTTSGNIAPSWSDNSTNSTTAGAVVSHNVYWTDSDSSSISGYIFSFDNGTGTLSDDSWIVMDSSNWTNVSKIVNFTEGSTIQWIVYANDSDGDWNQTDTFSYDTTSCQIGLELIYPSAGSSTNITQNTFFNVTLNVSCLDGYCGDVNVSLDPWYNTSFDKCRDIDISNVGSSTLSNFPVYINITNTTDMLPDYKDLRFVNASCNNGGSQLDHEIENYTASDVDVWIRIPSLLAAGINISVYYKNNTAVSSGENPTGVWDDNFVLVMHLNEASGNPSDSSGADNNADAATITTYQATGKVGYGIDMVAANSDEIRIPDSEDWAFTAAFTIEAWIETDVTDVYAEIFRHYESTTKDGFRLRQTALGSGDYGFQVFVDGVPPDDDIKSDNPPSGNFEHVVGVRNGSGNMTMFVNASEQTDSGSMPGAINSTNPVYIGSTGSTGYYDGALDELRISNISRSADWINQSYQIVANQGTYVTIGNEESSGKGGLVPVSSGTPFYTNASSNPQTASGLNFNSPEQTIRFWVNATGSVGDYDFFTYVNQTINQSIGNITGTWEMNITGAAANNPPTIDWVEAITAQNPTDDSVTSITFNFTATDPDGYTNINVSTAQGRFNRTGEPTRSNTSCVNWSQSGNDVNFTCTIDMWYFDQNGAWTINATIQDDSAEYAENSSTTFTYNSLPGMKMSPTSLTWQEVLIGQTNSGSQNDPIVVNNTGNTEPLNINVTSYNLRGETDTNYFIYANNFTVENATEGCTGTVMSNATSINITSAILQRGNHSLNYKNATSGQEELFFCLTEVPSGISQQSYSSSAYGAWEIRILLVAIIPARRRKKQKKKKEIENLSIPATIFSENIGTLETVIKYLRENLGMSYSEIGRYLNRDERTIWTAYQKAVQKQHQMIEVRETKVFLPISVLRNRKLTILESVIVYLKSKEMKYSEIAEIIKRDQRNIRTAYQKAIGKLEEKEFKDLIKAEAELIIPITIFSKKLGALEALTKYMKENLNMGYKEIAELLNRDERTIYTAYQKAKEKQKKPIKITKIESIIPISIFKDKKLTILESIIIYLKEKEFKFSKIAELLDRDQRNIWTIYSRTKKKIYHKNNNI